MRDGNTLQVSTFAGRGSEGMCMQLTPLVPADHYQFTRLQAMALADLIDDFLELWPPPRKV
jgi:hypothetical protein